ncbi:MAG: PLP-dependent aminotransferase family protein, partial [Actinobacteria bacterium]|nr:PLP-dependent aminotransferase family protein [Actinomycetota bacterium]
PPLGDPRLREQIALHAQRSRGIRCTPDDVIVTGGTADALLLVGLALGAGSRIAMEDPGYPEAAQVLTRAGAMVEPIPVLAEGLTAAQLGADRFAAVLVTPSHQFPLGGRMPAAERTALVAWAAEHGSVIIEDDYDSEFRHTGAALPAIAALDAEYPGGGVVAHIGSLNKSFSPGLRCGYLISASGSRLHSALSEAKADIGATTPAVIQSATAAFFASGGFRRYVARVRREYRHRRELLLDRLAAHGLADQLSGTDGGLHAVLRLPHGPGLSERSGTELAARLAHKGVLVESISEFRRAPGDHAAEDTADDAIAIGYGAEPALRLERGIDAVIRALRS